MKLQKTNGTGLALMTLADYQTGNLLEDSSMYRLTAIALSAPILLQGQTVIDQCKSGTST